MPIDGVITEGHSSLNTVALTGESLPRSVKQGDAVISGCINTSGLLHIRTTKAFAESTASKILKLVEEAGSRKSKSENFIAKFARVYTPIVVFAALALAIVPPLVRIVGMGMAPEWGTWIYRALTFLVISCPCALVISIPLSFFAGIGGASREGVLVKGSNYMETLADVDTVVFDKTGTLTKGVLKLRPFIRKPSIRRSSCTSRRMSNVFRRIRLPYRCAMPISMRPMTAGLRMWRKLPAAGYAHMSTAGSSVSATRK